MQPLDKNLRNQLERTIREARGIADRLTHDQPTGRFKTTNATKIQASP